MKYYRDGIMESLHDIDYDRYYHNSINEKSILRLLDLTEAYSIIAKSEMNSEAINEANSLANKAELIIKEYNYRKHAIKEGFTNPFDDIDDHTIDTRYIEKVDVDPDEEMKIRKVKLWNNNTDNKIMFRNGKMIAGQFFGKGDEIEACPVRLIYEKDLYSENIRDFVFDIDRQKGIYAIPFGYASFYRNSRTCNTPANSDYEYVYSPDGSYIRIYATGNIKKGHEIILHADDSDFQNEIKPGQFTYDMGEDPFYSVKNIKIA